MSIASNERDVFGGRRFEVGDVATITSEVVISGGHEHTRRDVVVGDESDADPELRESYVIRGNFYELYLRANPDIPGTHIEPKTDEHEAIITIPEENEAAQWLYRENGQATQMMEWAEKFPTAIALEPLQRLENGGSWLRAGGLDERTLNLFTNMVDGIALRSRARIYVDQLKDYADRTKAESLNILSLGSGAAVPNMQATRELEAKDVAVHWQFYDFDPNALLFAQKLEEENEFQYSTFDYGPIGPDPKTGEMGPRGRNYLRAFSEVAEESMDVVDALGLLEYLPPKVATKFVVGLYPKLKPGGSMIFSNMLPSRPQFQFNKDAVGWPKLHYRSDENLLDIIKDAGIDTRQVTMTHDQPDRDVYVVVEIRKP